MFPCLFSPCLLCPCYYLQCTRRPSSRLALSSQSSTVKSEIQGHMTETVMWTKVNYMSWITTRLYYWDVSVLLLLFSYQWNNYATGNSGLSVVTETKFEQLCFRVPVLQFQCEKDHQSSLSISCLHLGCTCEVYYR